MTDTPKLTKRGQPQADYRVTLNGKDLSPLIAPDLISLTLSECRSDEADTVEITIDDSKGKYDIPKRGDSIKVSLGWMGDRLVDKGSFTVDEVEHAGAPDVITIHGRSASMSSDMHERREKSWHGASLGAMVRTIAARYSMTPVVSAKLGAIVIAHIDQTHESDMSFLTRLAKRYDAVMNVKDNRLVFMPVGEGVTASGKALPVIALTRQDGDRHRYHVSERENYSAVRAHYHSNGRAKRLSVIVGGENNHNVKVLPEDYATKEEALAAAEAEYKRTQRGQATLDYTLARGRADVFPELPVTVTGFKPDIDQTAWLVKLVRHSLTGDGGFTSELSLEMREDPTTDRHRSHFRKVRKS